MNQDYTLYKRGKHGECYSFLCFCYGKRYSFLKWCTGRRGAGLAGFSYTSYIDPYKKTLIFYLFFT